MYTVAVLTAKETNPKIKPYLILDGEKDKYIKKLEEIGVNVIIHRATFNSELEKFYKNDALSISLGAFLRVDIPLICKNLNIDTDNILYTDNDVMFISDISELVNLKPKYFLVAGEFSKEFSGKLLNSGVMWINWRTMLSEHKEFVFFIVNNLNKFKTFDQDAIRLYYGSKCEKLNYKFNYKPYWGDEEDIKILHFHGPKPTQQDNIPQIIKGLSHPYFFEMSKKFHIILNKFNDDNNNIFDS